MATTTPSTEIRLLRGVRLTPSYNDSIYFANETAQEMYFKGKTHVVLSDYSFVRTKPNTVRVSATIQNCRTCNYIMIHNDGFFGEAYKYIYAFIVDVNYINNGTTEITYEIDYIQTFISRCSFGRCWIERNHVEDDSLFYHQEPDYLPNSETIARSTFRVGFQAWSVVLWVTEFFEDGQWYESNFYTGKRYGGSLHPLVFPLYNSVGTISINSEGLQDLLDTLEFYDLEGKLDTIKAITMYPTDLYNNNGHITYTGITPPNGTENFSMNPGDETTQTSYTPDNKKCYIYPYNYLILKAASGQKVYKYEEISDKTLHIVGALSPDATLTAFIGDMASSSNKVYNQFDSISIGNLPSVSLNVDYFYNWLANNPYSLINTALGIGVNTGEGNLAGAISGVMSGAQAAHSVAMNHMRGMSNATATTDLTLGNIGFVVEYVSSRITTLRTVDDYFTKYGYAINKLRTPEFNNRPHYTYIKTRDAIVYGNNGYNANEKIADILNKGITFWKDGDEIGNYGVNNKPT